MATELSTIGPRADHARLQAETVAINEALVLGALRQHELTEAAEQLNAQLQLEIAARQKSARELEEKARLLDLSHDAIIVRSFDDKITFWNKGAERLYGWSNTEVLGLDLHSLLRTEFPKPRAAIEAQVKREGQFSGEVTQRAREGQKIVSLCRWVLDRETNSVLTSYTDITDRQRAEEALRASEDQFRALFASAPMAIFSCDREAVIQQYNVRAVELWGRAPERGVERHGGSIRLWRPDGQPLPPEESPTASVLLTGAPALNVEIAIERPDGSRVPVLVNSAALMDAKGGIIGAITSFVDLTERKKLEQHSLRSQRMESIGTLAGGIAHDLNNALGPVIAALELLRMKEHDRAALNLIDLAESSAQRGAAMVRQILGFARGVEGERKAVQVPHLIREIEKTVTDTFLARVKIQTRVAPDVWTVLGDSTQLYQVLLNLCLNARDAMPAGGILEVSAANRQIEPTATGLQQNANAKPGPYVLLEVTDHGTGIPPGTLENIFDPFFTTKEFGQGSGLGLSTSLAIIKSHGGFVDVITHVGKGTTFQAFLPAQITVALSAPAQSAPGVSQGNGELILVVDDEAPMRLIIQRVLESFGYRAILADGGAEAIAIYASRGSEFAAVITDMTMPSMDGLETIRLLRGMNPQLPIIGASGLASTVYGPKLVQLGVKHILPKPFRPAAMLSMLKQLLAESRSPDEEKSEHEG